MALRKLTKFDWRNTRAQYVRVHRQRWHIDQATLAGRADVALKNLQEFEGGKTWKYPDVWLHQVGKALRQMIYERAVEAVALYGPEIAADPDAAFYTAEAAARRRVERYRMYDTIRETPPVAINSADTPKEADDGE